VNPETYEVLDIVVTLANLIACGKSKKSIGAII